MARTTAEFLDGVKRRVIYPANQELLTSDDLLSLASDLLQIKMTKKLKAARQNHLLATEVIPLVSGQDAYDVPYRAVSSGCEDVKYLLSDGVTLRKLTYITIEDLQYYTNSSGDPKVFYFEADQIKVAPAPSAASGSLKVWYHRRLSRLCNLEDAGQVTGINGDTVTLSSTPSTFIAGFVIDFVKEKTMSTVLSQDVTITNVAGTTLTFASGDVPSRLVVGDWIAPAGFTPIVPLMEEAWDYFEGECGVTILNSIGDYEGSARLKEENKDDEKDFMTMLEPRIDGEPEKITNYDGLLRQKTYRSFGFRR